MVWLCLAWKNSPVCKIPELAENFCTACLILEPRSRTINDCEPIRIILDRSEDKENLSTEVCKAIFCLRHVDVPMSVNIVVCHRSVSLSIFSFFLCIFLLSFPSFFLSLDSNSLWTITVESCSYGFQGSNNFYLLYMQNLVIASKEKIRENW